MTWKPAICLLLLFAFPGVSFAQWGASAEKSAARNIDKGRWQKAQSTIVKHLEKQPVNPTLRYVFASYYFHQANPAFNLDSAYQQAVRAIEDYARSSSRERDKLRRVGADSLGLVRLRADIDSTAFEVARKKNTEAAYLEFLSHFPLSVQRDLAAELRDEVAFQDAVRENTYRAFNQYLARYPQSKRKTEALEHYNRLLYFEGTKDRRLSSFEKFLNEHPETPYRSEIYRNIYEITTADGTVESFLAFMARYPDSPLVKQAEQMIFHILAEEDDPEWPANFLNDSLRSLLEMNNIFLVPFLQGGRYGFMNGTGEVVIAAHYNSVHPDYLCGHVTDEILAVDDQLIARNGSPVYAGKVSWVQDLGAGFLLIEASTGKKIIHKGGFVFADSVEDARLTSKSFLSVRKNGSWFIYSLGGRLLDPKPWKDISSFDQVIVFSSDNQKFIVPRNQLIRSADGAQLPLSEPFDDVRQWPRGLIWGASGDFQGVLDQSLQGVIRFDKHTLTQTAFGAIGKLPNGVVLYNWTGRKSSVYDQVSILGDKVAVKKNGQWFFLNSNTLEIGAQAFDSLRAEGPFVLAIKGDSVTVHFKRGGTQSFYKPQKIAFVPGKDSTSFLVVQKSARDKQVFDLRGGKLFASGFDALEYVGKDIFAISKKDRKGLVNRRGESLLATEYDAIGTIKGSVISVLKNKKFGAYNTETRKFIKPDYDRNPIPYNASTLLTHKNGSYGFIGWDNKPLSPFEFDEVQYWNDSIALTKKGAAWGLYDIQSHRLIENNLRSVELIRDDSNEKIAIVQKDKYFGVISNHGEVVIPMTFTAVRNLGSAESPLYFTEKHIPEASLYIVIYYDRSGSMLRKEIYDDAGDYDMIYCSHQ